MTQYHHRALRNHPDKLIRRTTLGAQLNQRGLRQGAISNCMTYNRIEYLAKEVGEGQTIAEYLVDLLDAEMKSKETET